MHKEDKAQPWWHAPLMSFFKISAWIAGPILFGVIAGDFLDKKFQTSPWAEMILTGLFFMFSIYHMVKDGKKYEEEIEHELHPDHNDNQITEVTESK
jgi:F0F1-type ATP synthase assembly protein I